MKTMTQNNHRPDNAGRSHPAQKPWLSYLMLVPLAAGVVVLAVFFFAVAIALFALFALGFAARMWWLRRRIGAGARDWRSAGEQPLTGEYKVVPEEVGQKARRIRR